MKLWTYGFREDTKTDASDAPAMIAPGDPIPVAPHHIEIAIACEFFDAMSSMNDTQREFILGTVRGMWTVEHSIGKS